MLRTGLLMSLAVWLTGCAAPTLYSRTHYEELVYLSYAKPDKATPEMQVKEMQADMQKAQSANQALPPGFHAHLGYLYYQLGQVQPAQQEFQAEKAQFPESAVFMDRLLANLDKK